jgi:signal transduction histidine kinase
LIPKRTTRFPRSPRNPDFYGFSQRVLGIARRPVPLADFCKESLTALIEHSGCDCAQLHLEEDGRHIQAEVWGPPRPAFRFKIRSGPGGDQGPFVSLPLTFSPEPGTRATGQEDPGLGGLINITAWGSLWTGEISRCLDLRPDLFIPPSLAEASSTACYESLAAIPLFSPEPQTGFLILKSLGAKFFSPESIMFLESITPILSAALRGQRAQEALQERVKELTCLYRMANLSARPDLSVESFLNEVSQSLSLAMQYPETAAARVILDGAVHSTPDFPEKGAFLTAPVVLKGQVRGRVDVAYRSDHPVLDEGPFLKEERSLINTVAAEIGLIIERKHGEEDRARLEGELRHADRLATIGQLAAGVAHELNEPLGAMLGFAQLAQKARDLPPPVGEDLTRIIRAGLHAREVVRKLLLFSREVSPQKVSVNLNQLVEQGFSFLDLESRCAKAGIEVVRRLAPALPSVMADHSQLNQVLVNLVVNAIQAMPTGGKLTLQTLQRGADIVLAVEDTGIGMSEEVRHKIFTPFFTTKDIGHGTGLGLPVVHGIVKSHGGSIHFETEVGRGTRFEVIFPCPEEEALPDNA